MTKQQLARQVRTTLAGAGFGKAYYWQSGWAQGRDGVTSASGRGHVAGYRVEAPKGRGEARVVVHYEAAASLNRKAAPLYVFHRDCRVRWTVLRRYQDALAKAGLIATTIMWDDDAREWPYLEVAADTSDNSH